MPRLRLKRGHEQGVKAGYLWIHPGDVERISPSAQDGWPVDVTDSRDRFLGRALLNTRSPIVARLYSRTRLDWGAPLLEQRICAALERRRRWGLDLAACRLVFGESDLLPGLVVDRYGDVGVLRINHPAVDRFRGQLVEFLCSSLDLSAVYERSDGSARNQEGMSPASGLLWGRLPREIRITEGTVRLGVDVVHGQKTGHYLDQKRNRVRVGPWARDRRVLDLFCYTGGFGLQALAGGAASVAFADSSARALEAARIHAEEAGWGARARFLEANAFDLLRALERQGERFDLVCLDPPAFAPSRQALARASRGYKELNLRALKLLAPGGILVSSSCSSHLPVGLHLQIITEAAADAGRGILLLHQWGQDLDHPVLPAHPPTRYLKCHVVEVME